jgi:geranylgeranyl diphosphate synthase, type II
MKSFEELSGEFAKRFEKAHFPQQPTSLYDPAAYFLGLGGKRIRPVLCLMGNELFAEIEADAWQLATAIELFHNFTLIHDDIMDKAPLRRGKQTVHEKYGSSTALLAGDVMLVEAYDTINRIGSDPRSILHLFNATARAVCEGQQTDMDFEKKERVGFDEYLHMIELKTSVLLAASLQMGSILGGAGLGNQQHLYEFGKLLGLAFQIQDDYLDAYGDPAKFGKQVGGDIVAGKKTFLLIRALEEATAAQLQTINELERAVDPAVKIAGMLELFKTCGVDAWARELKEKYMERAYQHLEDIAVLSRRKEPLKELAGFLVQREY